MPEGQKREREGNRQNRKKVETRGFCKKKKEKLSLKEDVNLQKMLKIPCD